MLSYGANLYSRVITGMSIQDATGGFKVWKKEVLESIDLKKIRSNGYSFQIEINFLAWIKRFILKEIPIVFTDRTVGESKMNRGIIVEAILMVPKLLIKKLLRAY
jgi:dolichol-phosphate mannosyltransferase